MFKGHFLWDYTFTPSSSLPPRPNDKFNLQVGNQKVPRASVSWNRSLSKARRTMPAIYLPTFLAINRTRADNAPFVSILDEFPYLAPRIVHLLEQMENWRPRMFRELFVPEGYSDRSNWWVSMFAIFLESCPFWVWDSIIIRFTLDRDSCL